MTRYVMAFNGPPGAGKDTAGNFAGLYMDSLGYDVHELKMSSPMKNAVDLFCGIEIDDLSVDREVLKPMPTPWGADVNFRQAYIAFSEEFAKPLWGRDVFGRIAVYRMAHEDIDTIEPRAQVFIIADAGFLPEQECIIKYVTPNNYALARLFRVGHDFSNDSRSYIYPEQRIHHESLYNDGDLELLKSRVIRFCDTAIKVGQWTPVLPR